jgi:dTDP-4-amino-4,6-dideoxygalactose transaminase
MSEINALLAYSVINETESIIDNKYKIANKYIESCENFNWEYINPTVNSQRTNLYKFILLSRNENPEQDFQSIKTRTSPVYDYLLGDDKSEITKRHICLPIWYGLEDSIVDNVVSELRR